MKQHSPVPLLAPFFAFMGAFFVLPLLLVVVYSFLQAGPYGGVEWHFSLGGYQQIFFDRDFDGTLVFNPEYFAVFWRSLRLALYCTVLCLLAGVPMACHMATLPAKRRAVWMMLVTIPFWTNLLVRTYAWILILRDQGLINSLLMDMRIIDTPLPMMYNEFAVGLGIFYTYLPFMVLPVFAAVERMDKSLIEAASDLYAGRWHIFRHVMLPQAMPGIVSGAILVFIPAIGAFVAGDLLGGGKKMMIGNLIQLQFGFSRNWPFGAAASVVMMALVLLGLWYAGRRRRIEDLNVLT